LSARTLRIGQVEQLYSDGHESARVMALVAHPYIMGAPHRLRYLQEALEHILSRSGVLFWTGGQMSEAAIRPRASSPGASQVPGGKEVIG
jgi:allantoinase